MHRNSIKINFALASLFAVGMSVAPKAQAADVLVEGSFSVSNFSSAVTPDPFDLLFTSTITIDDAILASNGDFQVTTVLDTIGPNPLTIGTDSFTADQIAISVQRYNEDGNDFLYVVLGIGSLSSITQGTNDFSVSYVAEIGNEESTVSQTVGIVTSSAPLLANEGVLGIQTAGTASGFVTLETFRECEADANGDGILDNGDIITFVGLFLAGNPAADMNADGILDNGDIITFVSLFLAGC